MTLGLNRSRPSPDDVARIKAWANEHLELGEDNVLVVAELACREPGCPPVETVIAVLGPKEQRHTIHKPVSDVTQDDVVLVLADVDRRPDASS